MFRGHFLVYYMMRSLIVGMTLDDVREYEHRMQEETNRMLSDIPDGATPT